MECNGFIWLRIGKTTNCEHVNKPLSSMKLREFEYFRNYYLFRDKLLHVVKYNVHTVQIRNMAAEGNFILICI
jgi:hypothetical protein